MAINPRKYQKQIQTNWCWAASALNMLLSTSKSHHNQCDIAKTSLLTVVPAPSCCNDQKLNIPHLLDKTINDNGGKATWTGIIKASALTKQIDQKKPIGVRIQWSGGSGHFIIIVGYKYDVKSNLECTIFDPSPKFGFSKCYYKDLIRTNGFRSSGTWHQTILMV